MIFEGDDELLEKTNVTNQEDEKKSEDDDLSKKNLLLRMMIIIDGETHAVKEKTNEEMPKIQNLVGKEDQENNFLFINYNLRLINGDHDNNEHDVEDANND